MSFIPVIKYILGIGVMAFVGWLLNGILEILVNLNILVDNATWEILMYLYYGMYIIYLIFGGIWLVRTYDEEEYQFPRHGG